jgi:hypothetical protein
MESTFNNFHFDGYIIHKLKKNISEKTFPNHLLVQINQFVMVISSKQTQLKTLSKALCSAQ